MKEDLKFGVVLFVLLWLLVGLMLLAVLLFGLF